MRIPIARHIPLARSAPLAPMVDLVLLLVFLLLLEAEIGRGWRRFGHAGELRLPAVRASVPDDNPDPWRLVVDVAADGRIYVGDEPRSDAWLRDCLEVEARISRRRDGSADRQVLIRADEHVEFRHIQKIIDLCRHARIRIWRLAFATRPGDGDSPDE